MSPMLPDSPPLSGTSVIAVRPAAPVRSDAAAHPAATPRSSIDESRGMERLLLGPRGGQVLEAGVLLDESHVDVADGPRAVLEEEHFGDALLLGVGLVVFLAVEGHDGVGVLLD